MVLQGILKASTIIAIIRFCVFMSLQANITEAKIGYFWHITDLHFDSFYSRNGDVAKNCWDMESRQNKAKQHPGHFGDYNCDSPWSLIESALQTMKSRQGDNIEFVLWTGDGLSHSLQRLIDSSRLEHLRNITELLKLTFPSQFVFPVLGHEDGNLDLHSLGDLWRPWLPSEALHTFERGGYYTIEQTKSRLRIIALNTNFMKYDNRHSHHSAAAAAAVRQRTIAHGENSEYSNFNYHQQQQQQHQQHQYNTDFNGGGYHSDGTVSALSSGEKHEREKQWEWFEEVLAKSSRNKETVYIVGHYPPGSDERQVVPNAHSYFSEKNNVRYLKLVRKYSSIIQGQFFGHLHSDTFRVIYSDKGKPVSWMMLAPSVAPKKNGVGSNNPAMRLYKFETDTGQVLDYTQYYLDLAAANKLGEAVWQSEYNLTSYHYTLVSEVSAVALHNLADHFTNSENVHFLKYLRANTVRHTATNLCDDNCALNHYCAITRVDYSELRQCLVNSLSVVSRSVQSSSSTIAISLFFPLLIVLLSQPITLRGALSNFTFLAKYSRNYLITLTMALLAALVNFISNRTVTVPFTIFLDGSKYLFKVLRQTMVNSKYFKLNYNYVNSKFITINNSWTKVLLLLSCEKRNQIDSGSFKLTANTIKQPN